jgi:membrane-associated PAP2 superfamily phosphatase
MLCCVCKFLVFPRSFNSYAGCIKSRHILFYYISRYSVILLTLICLIVSVIYNNFFSIFYSEHEGVDVVIVYMHWGKEYQLHPNRRQLSIAKYLHSLGVSAVIGAHPHVLQPHSRTTDHLTAYSVGNFLFPQIKECLTVGFLFQSCRVH